MYGSPIVLINRPPASCRKIGADHGQKLKISLEWPKDISKFINSGRQVSDP